MDFYWIRAFFQWVWELVAQFNYRNLSIISSYFRELLLTFYQRIVSAAFLLSTEETSRSFLYETGPKREFNVYIVTWNVASKPPPPADRMLNMMKIDDDWNRANDKDPDLYIIGLQEVGVLTLPKISAGSSGDSLWHLRLKEILTRREYVLVRCKAMQAVRIFCFAKRKHLLHLRKIEAEQTRTGLGGLLANKGAVSIRLSLSGCAVCFVNSHLASNEHSPEERLEDYKQIIDNHRYKLPLYREIFTHDIIFWFGDLNFRLTRFNKLSPEEILRLIEANDRNKLLHMDELKQFMKEGMIFQQFVEKVPNFPPTYKFDYGSPFYNLKRKPAWTDRILYRVKSNPYKNVHFQVTQGIYTSFPECDISDHRPVASEFNIKFIDATKQKIVATKRKPKMERVSVTAEATIPRQIFVDQTQNIIEFDHIPHWLVDGDNIIDYTLPPSFCEHPGNDWIGIFRSDFDDLSKYIAYQYVPPAYVGISETMPSTSGGCNTRRRRRMTLNFSENSVNIVMNRKYVLLYIEREEGSAMGVAGISNSFAAKYGTQTDVVHSEVEIKKED